jgi:hypothetical protein
MSDEFVNAIPLIKKWIDSTLDKNAHLARPVSSKGFPRLSSYFSGDLLDKAKFVIVQKIPMPPLSEMGVHIFSEFENGDFWGITYNDTFFLDKRAEGFEETYFHELVHVIQWNTLGIDRFLLEYASGLIKNGYRKCPLEVMAYVSEDWFTRNPTPVIVESIIRSRLREMYQDLI